MKQYGLDFCLNNERDSRFSSLSDDLRPFGAFLRAGESVPLPAVDIPRKDEKRALVYRSFRSKDFSHSLGREKRLNILLLLLSQPRVASFATELR